MGHSKLASSDFAPSDQMAYKRTHASTDPMSCIPVSPDAEEPANAVEAVRYLFLAKELRRLGQTQAADRWQAKAAAWLNRLSASGGDE